MTLLRTLPVLAVSTLAVGLTACGGPSSVSESDVETTAATKLAEQVDNGVTPDIDCPGDLESTKGTTMRCTLSVDGDDATYGMTVTVTGVKDDKTLMDFEVDEQPQD